MWLSLAATAWHVTLTAAVTTSWMLLLATDWHYQYQVSVGLQNFRVTAEAHGTWRGSGLVAAHSLGVGVARAVGEDRWVGAPGECQQLNGTFCVARRSYKQIQTMIIPVAGTATETTFDKSLQLYSTM